MNDLEFMVDLSTIADIVTAIGIIPIAYVAIIKIMNYYNQKKTINLDNKEKRSKYFLELCKEPSLIDKISITKDNIKVKKASSLLAHKFKFSIYADREKAIKKCLRFILSDEAIRAYPSINTGLYDKLEEMFFDFYSLLEKNPGILNQDFKYFDAWVRLKNNEDFVVSFPIPDELYDEEAINNICFGTKSIFSLDDDIVYKYFFPYLLLSISKYPKEFFPDDAYFIFSSLWKIGSK